ncbi:MAG: FecR domain-containing protein [Pseudobacter sp.]|uniref:FecR domain-containing protein n=1 Tax=Pseudobacter sp. TaxID=2045420 RepID=UPI003F815C19
MNERLAYLFQQLYANRITAAEREEFYLLVQDPEQASAVKELIAQTYKTPALEELPEQRSHEILHAIFQSDPGLAVTGEPVVRQLPRRKWYRVAAAAVLILGASTWFLLQRSADKGPQVVVQQVPDIAAGKEGAILTLADGKQVVLDNIQDGIVAIEGGATATVVNGSLQYKGNTNEALLNTMRTPRGRQYKLTLPDGSKVWLNASSSIRYPVAFNGKERKVEVTGEAFFEVSPKAKHPFVVSVDQRAQVEVLGTSFNVNAYENETSITTTLIDGSVRVKNKVNEVKVLTPGQQAAVTESIIVSNANTEGVTSWMNGTFYFTHTNLAEVMRQIERWYDVEVVYEKGVPDVQLFGAVKRSLSLEGIIKGLKDMGVNLRLDEGKRLVVLPQ